MRRGCVAEQHVCACVCLWGPVSVCVCLTGLCQYRRSLGWLRMIKLSCCTKYRVSHLSNKEKRERKVRVCEREMRKQRVTKKSKRREQKGREWDGQEARKEKHRGKVDNVDILVNEVQVWKDRDGGKGGVENPSCHLPNPSITFLISPSLSPPFWLLASFA